MFKHIYKKYIKMYLPRFLWENISYLKSFLLNDKKKSDDYKKRVLNIYKSKIDISAEECKAINYLEKNKYFGISFEWDKEYINRKINFNFDKSCKMYYVLWNDKKLYFHREIAKKHIQSLFNSLASEMDLLSPHRYVTKENNIIGTIERESTKNEQPFFVKKGDIVADIGASCGNFALSVVDIAKHIYIFECDDFWIEALEKTFENYKNKVTIVKKYVSNEDTDTNVRLDTYFADKEINFIKTDIEGYENKMLEGANELILKRKNLNISICVYHKPNDDIDFKNYFKEKGYETYFTEGLILPFFYNYPSLMEYNKTTDKYFRKAILRALPPAPPLN